ncbi:hypothetical protein [Enterovirga sp.]|uniref:hypothetical protein n=1 Tax=Enterovirga sp. TaxID=2026350 RepID=UPI002C2F4AC5|nr:hypothetical protein [Enterovirga sp.]HMO28904.1 hypothetical protein [Enterovirga sp.]
MLDLIVNLRLVVVHDHVHFVPQRAHKGVHPLADRLDAGDGAQGLPKRLGPSLPWPGSANRATASERFRHPAAEIRPAFPKGFWIAMMLRRSAIAIQLVI